jgi:hypothetical protein
MLISKACVNPDLISKKLDRAKNQTGLRTDPVSNGRLSVSSETKVTFSKRLDDKGDNSAR